MASRYYYGRDVALKPLRAGRDQTRWACAHNISRGGVGLVLRCRVPRGVRFLVELSDPTRPRPGVIGRVVHRRLGFDGNWYVGCAFDEAVDEDRLRALAERS